MNSIISSTLLKYNFGIDTGNDMMTIIFEKNSVIPNTKNIQFIIPEINEKYIIKIVTGDNILTNDNIILKKLNIISPTKILYFKFNLYISHINIIISVKNKDIYNGFIKYYNNDIQYYNKKLDINRLNKLFELDQTIKIIINKINKNIINIPMNEKEQLLMKLNNLDKNNTSTLKLIDINNLLKNKFCIN